MTVDEILRDKLEGYAVIRELREENAIAFEVLSDVGTGVIGDISNWWDTIEFCFDAFLKAADVVGFKFPKQKYVAAELKRQGYQNGYMTILTYAYYHEVTSYWWATYPRITAESTFELY